MIRLIQDNYNNFDIKMTLHFYRNKTIILRMINTGIKYFIAFMSNAFYDMKNVAVLEFVDSFTTSYSIYLTIVIMFLLLKTFQKE